MSFMQKVSNFFNSNEEDYGYNSSSQEYYDESNNYRVFRIKNGKFNEAPEKYFVLGGVCTKTNSLPNFSQLEQELRLQPNCEEIKSRNFYLRKIQKTKMASLRRKPK